MSDQRNVVFDRDAVHCMEGVWFGPAEGAALTPRSIRLHGFDLTQPRCPIESIPRDPNRHDEYLAWRESLVHSHGGVPGVAFYSVATVYGFFAPDLLCLDAWPDVASLDRFQTSREMRQLRSERGIVDVAFSAGRLDDAFRASPEGFKMSFDTESTYEFCAFWKSPAWTQERQRAFFESVIPSRARHEAGAGVVIIPTLGDYLPDLLSLSQWPTLDAFAAFVNDPEHTEVSRKRLASFDRMDATATQLHPSHHVANRWRPANGPAS